MEIQNRNINPNNVAFSGHKKIMDKTGYLKHNFFYLYDPMKYNCEVELYNIDKDGKNNYTIADKNPAKVINMGAKGISVDLSDIPELYTDKGYAYRFKLTDKSDNSVSYAFDNGSVIGIFDNDEKNKYNLVLTNRATLNKNGAMQLIMPDGYYPGVINKNGNPEIDEALRTKALSSVRNHANKLGGNFQGIIKRLPEISKEGISRIVGTPFTKDSISSHKYWTENAYQISKDFGTEEDFRKLQEELFKNDINWISDAALVNEGFGGIHMAEFMRKGQESISKNMFRASEHPMLGILPDKSDYTRLKFLNAPFRVSSDGKISQNKDYDMKKPTYIQFYDDRLASEQQKASKEPITTYANTNTKNIYDITKHDDAVYPYALEVNPDELYRNVSNIVKKGKELDLGNLDVIKKIADFSTFGVTTKSESGGIEVWDGNVDIPKLNFYRSIADDERFLQLPKELKDEAVADFDRGTLSVRDYALNSGKFWTKLTDDIQFTYAANLFENKAKTADEYMKLITDLVNSKKLPKSTLKVVDKEVIENVLNDNYHSKKLDDMDMRNSINPEGYGNEYSEDDYILRQAMDVPLETMPVGTNLLGILTSPYIAKKANTEQELGVSRYDILKANNPNLPEKYRRVYEQADELYTEKIVPLIKAFIQDIPGVSENGEVTEYGKYIISEVTPELTKMIITKALNPDAVIKFKKDGHLDFTEVNENDITMQSVGIPYNSKTSEEEAQMLLDVINNGIENNITPKDVDHIKSRLQLRFKDRSLNDCKIAEMILDRTESGLGWRIDAAKDIASIDAVRSGKEDMIKTWDNVIDFWKRYNQELLKINPHAYTTAEITDLSSLISRDDNAKYMSDADAERKFLEETGITSVANYNYFFTLPPALFTDYDPDEDKQSWMAEQSKNFKLLEKMDTGWSGTNPGFLFQSPADGVANSYTFGDNHDKRRLLHHFALDMYLFNTVPMSEAMVAKKENILKNLEAKKASGENLTDDEAGKLYRYSLDIDRDKKFKSVAAKVLMQPKENINYDKLSAKSIAMGYRLDNSIDSVVKDEMLREKLKDAVSHLASGEYMGRSINNEAFGTRPFEIAIKTVMDEAELTGKIADRENIERQLLKNILEPALDRLQTLTKLYTVLPGSPTDFAGDRMGVSGDETKAKNYEQQNRNIINWEYLNNPDYSYIMEHYKAMNNISNLRNRKELSALNDGATVTLPMKNEFVQAILRYNEDSAVIALTDSSGSTSSNEEKMDRTKKYYGNPLTDGSKKVIKDKINGQTICDGAIDKIPLDIDGATLKQGLKHGLSVGTKFKNARPDDKSVYIVKKEPNGKYYIERQGLDGQNKPCKLPIIIDEEDKNTLILYRV